VRDIIDDGKSLSSNNTNGNGGAMPLMSEESAKTVIELRNTIERLSNAVSSRPSAAGLPSQQFSQQ